MKGYDRHTHSSGHQVLARPPVWHGLQSVLHLAQHKSSAEYVVQTEELLKEKINKYFFSTKDFSLKT